MSTWQEGKVRKGGLNKAKQTPRPFGPEGQGRSGTIHYNIPAGPSPKELEIVEDLILEMAQRVYADIKKEKNHDPHRPSDL